MAAHPEARATSKRVPRCSREKRCLWVQATPPPRMCREGGGHGCPWGWVSLQAGWGEFMDRRMFVKECHWHPPWEGTGRKWDWAAGEGEAQR